MSTRLDSEHRSHATAVRSVPSRAGSAARVLMLTDDPETGIVDLARAIGSDPAFASKVLALANSAYFGLSGRVGSLEYAISVLGFQMIRALAVSIAAGLDKPDGVPDGFWLQAATAATAANILAPTFGAKPADAFSVGLLHTLGSALLHQQQPLPDLCLPYPDSQEELDCTEYEVYGIGHAQAGAQALAAWQFPRSICTLVARHHEPRDAHGDPLADCLHAARTLTDLALAPDQDERAASALLLTLSEGRLTHRDVAPLVTQIVDRSAGLLEGLNGVSA